MKNKKILCDLCGSKITNNPFPVYNENNQIQKGLKQCGCALIVNHKKPNMGQEEIIPDIEQAYYNGEINLNEALVLAYNAGLDYADNYHDKIREN